MIYLDERERNHSPNETPTRKNRILSEAILVHGEAISQTTSGNFGYSTGKSLALGYLPVEMLDQSDFEIEAFGRRSRATIIKGAAYDPKKTKILC